MGDVVEWMKRVPVVEREANKFFRVLGFMAGDDSVMKCVEEIVIELEQLVEGERDARLADDSLDWVWNG